MSGSDPDDTLTIPRAEDTIPCGPPSSIERVGTTPRGVPIYTDPNAPQGGVTLHSDLFDLAAFLEDDDT
jgi:hypothetical protein